VTSGPGLAGALLVGITYAKALAFAQGLPLIAVNHLEGTSTRCCCTSGSPSAGPRKSNRRSFDFAALRLRMTE